MEVRNYKLPPLPNKKKSVQIQLNSQKHILPVPRITSYSREKQIKRNQLFRPSSQEKQHQRPVSVRQKSIESVKSRQSLKSKKSKQSSNQKIQNNQQKKSSIHYNVKIRISMPTISAKSWAVYQLNQSKYIYGKRIFKRREIASLTKIMNFITILQLFDKNNLQASKIRIKVSKEASYISGTTAQLKMGIQINVQQLYYGMMLPSGNDAAHQIAEVGGALIQMQKNLGYIDKKIVYNIDQMTKFYLLQPFKLQNYLNLMNKISKKLQMKNSNFTNPHGLSNPDNYSCIEDLAKLCAFAMKNQIFRTVVYTQTYIAKYKYPIVFRSQFKQQNIENKQNQWGYLKWENTNKMLKEGWSGIKTGITPNAGPCLTASVKKYLNGRYLEFLIILINSKSMQVRWEEVKQIVDWVICEEIYF